MNSFLIYLTKKKEKSRKNDKSFSKCGGNARYERDNWKAYIGARLRSLQGDLALKLTFVRNSVKSVYHGISWSSTLLAEFLNCRIAGEKKISTLQSRWEQNANMYLRICSHVERSTAVQQSTIVRFEESQNYVRIPWHLCVAASARRPCRGSLFFPRFYYPPHIRT